MGYRKQDFDEFSHLPPTRPRVIRFDAIGEAWRLFQEQTGTWILAGLVVLLVEAALEAAVASAFHRPLPPGGGGFRPAVPPAGRLVGYVAASLISGCLLAGMFRMACRQVRGLPVRVSDLFGVTDVGREVVIGVVLAALAVFVGAMFCVLPGLIAAGVLMFTLPLIVDGRLAAPDAIRTSWHVLKGEWLSAAVFQFVLNIVAGLGICLCGVGILFTMPLYSLSVAVLYRDAFLQKGPAGPAKAEALDPDF